MATSRDNRVPGHHLSLHSARRVFCRASATQQLSATSFFDELQVVGRGGVEPHAFKDRIYSAARPCRRRKSLPIWSGVRESNPSFLSLEDCSSAIELTPLGCRDGI